MISEATGILDTEKIEKLNQRIRETLQDDDKDIMKLMCASSLAYHGVLGSMDWLELYDVDLGQVPAQHLASLASCVTSDLHIEDDVSGCDLVSILTSLKCETLFISMQSLGREETRALVQAMESAVENVTLSGQVTLDMEALTEYSGQGVCREVELQNDTAHIYNEEMRTWARSRKWRFDFYNNCQVIIKSE